MTRTFICILVVMLTSPLSAASLHNDRYVLDVAADGSVSISVSSLPVLRLAPQFTVLWTDTDPLCVRNASHPNYPVAPRNAVRWRNPAESLESLNAWVGTPEFRSTTGMTGLVKTEGTKRMWEFRDAQGKVKVQVNGDRAFDTTRPFTVGHKVGVTAARGSLEAGRLRWEFAPQAEFTLAAELTLPSGDADPELAFTLTPSSTSYFSVAFTGAPDAALADTLPVPQECDARGHKQFGFVMSEADLHLPRAQVSTASVNVALAADPRECRFRQPTMADSRFGFMLTNEEGRLKPVLLAPLLGGPESKMSPGKPWSFAFRCVIRGGDWKQTYAHIARDIQGFRDQRDNSGPGSLNSTLEHVMDFLADRHGGNHALWDPQQKYYDYFTDKTGIFKPFSPLYGLSAAIVTDDEEFYKQRARPAVEYALSRRTSVFAPYDNADNKQANSAGRQVGAPYISYAQLATLNDLFQGRTAVFRALAEAKAPAKGKLGDALAQWRLTGDAAALEQARALGSKALGKDTIFGEEEFFDLLDLCDATHDPRFQGAALEAAYHNVAKMNLYPMPPDAMVTVDKGGKAPVHYHSFGRHHNQWGFPPPQSLQVKEQTVPAWRISRLGLPGIAYPIEYWMNTHGAMVRTAALAHDDFLRDVARSGMVGRFGNFPGDNRSQNSLVPELPDAVDRRPWDWNFATVNAGHAWDFAGAIIDFLVSDAFEHSHGAIDFPALSAAGSNFRVRIQGGKPGSFYGDEGVHLWLPRGLVVSNNQQLDWVAAHGNGQLYLALWNQSFHEETAHISLDPKLVQCDETRDVRVWRDNAPAPPLRIAGNALTVTIPPKGIIAFAILATVKPHFYDATTPPLGKGSFTEASTPFGAVHAMLLRAGKDLTSAFVYAEVLPEKIIGARLFWHQGNEEWQEMTDIIYPYEFSPELRDEAGDFACVLEIKDNQQHTVRSPVITLSMGTGDALPVSAPAQPGNSLAITSKPLVSEVKREPVVTDDFLAYLQQGANRNTFGRHADGRFYPYSTPQGPRIGWRQEIWDLTLFANGCTAEEATQHLIVELSRSLTRLKSSLAGMKPSVDFAGLNKRQQETLLDFAWTEETVPPELLASGLAADWKRMVESHLYIRYAGHAPDHERNKAFAQRWLQGGEAK